MRGVASVICPNCHSEFLVPDTAVEALCPSCDDHIVWRSCRATGQAFPVLSRWPSWTHPGCSEVHAVRLVRSMSSRARRRADG